MQKEEQAKCEWCTKLLKGEPYYKGKPAYHFDTGKQCKVNYYGGFVCSYECDYKMIKAMHSSFPGAGECTRVDKRYLNNWNEE